MHDVVEDTDYTLSDLSDMGFSKDAVDALTLLTHDDSVPYMDYVALVKDNPVAKAKSVTKCTVCGTVSKTTTIYSPKTITLAKTSYTYNGKAISPTVTVKDSKGNVLKNGTDYTIKYASGRTNPGKYTVTITFKGNYSGTKTLTFSILPATPSISKITSSAKGKVNLTWKNVTGESGYEVYYSTKKDSGFKSLASYKTNITNGSGSKLTSGKTYYFKVRAYKTVNGEKIYSSWSSVKSIKIK